MKEIVFERELKVIIYYIREYGIQHLNYSLEIEKLPKDKNKVTEFYTKVHKGFSLAQKNVIILMEKVLLEQKKIKKELKQANQQRNKEQQRKFKILLNKAKYQEYVLRKAMDAIAWQLFQCDLSTMRRLYYGQRPIDITDSNLSSELSFINYYSENNPSAFVLISDLTSFIQIGDIVIMHPDKGIRIAELKEGIVNNEVLNLINDVAKTNCPFYLNKKLENKSDKFIEHFFRNVKQINRSSQVFEIIKTGQGKDLLTNQKIIISQELIELDTFTHDVSQLLMDCHTKGYAIKVIEGCLLIGVYESEKFSSQAFEAWVRELKINMPIFDMRQAFYDPLSYPIFIHPFRTKDILEIVSGKKIIKMTLDINQWLKSFEKEGCSIRWMSKKETARINSKLGKRIMFDIDGCGIELICKNGVKHQLGAGVFSRMFTSLNTPSSLKKYLLTDV